MSDALGAFLSHMKLGVVSSSPKLLKGRGRLERAQQVRAVVAALAEDPGSSQHPRVIAGLSSALTGTAWRRCSDVHIGQTPVYIK